MRFSRKQWEELNKSKKEEIYIDEKEDNMDDKMNNEKHIDFLKSIIRHLESNVKVSDTIVVHNIKEYIETIKTETSERGRLNEVKEKS